MNKRSIYIKCLDEGHGPVSPMPDELEGTSALMVNPAASVSVLLDAAAARASRVIDVTKPFLDLETIDFDFSREDACRLLVTVNAMAYEVCRLLVAAQTAKQTEETRVEEILRSYRQTVGAAVALIHAINAADLKRVPVAVAERGAIDEAVMEMMGHCDAARSDFLGGLDHE